MSDSGDDEQPLRQPSDAYDNRTESYSGRTTIPRADLDEDDLEDEEEVVEALVAGSKHVSQHEQTGTRSIYSAD